MASLYIKDSKTAELAAELAAAQGMSKTAAVYDALLRRKSDLQRKPAGSDLIRRLAQWRKDNPLPPPTGLKADKAFFDEMWGETPD